ncbi:hypothetical protein CsatA_001137 [Cannabis sativa]
MGRRAWDVELIKDMFVPHDQDLILSIQLSDSSRGDCWYWSKETSGVYSIRSAYKLLQQQNGDWPIDGADAFWKRIWQLHVPPKVQHLVWRVTSGLLPAKVQLSNKHIHVDLTCPLCTKSPESTSHVLFGCEFARSCWNLSSVTAAGVEEHMFTSWFSDILLSSSKQQAEETAMILWRLWLARNDVLWSNKSTTALEVVRSARTNLDTWKNAQTKVFTPLLNVNFSNGREHWVKPIETKFKMNVDGAIFEPENRFGFGCILRNGEAKLVEAFSQSKVGRVSPEIAEVVGVKEALSWIKAKNLSDVEIETDSLVVVQAINGSVQMPSQFGLLIQDCQRLLSDLNNVFISFLKRSANRAAHCIARRSCFMSDCIYDELSAPSDLLSIVRDDSFSS